MKKKKLISWLIIHKWIIRWLVLGLGSLIIFIIICIIKNQIYLQLCITIITLIAMILIMLQNNENIKNSTENQIDHYRKLNDKQIITMQTTSKMQIENINEKTNDQIEAIKHSTHEQIQVFIEQCQGIIAQLEQVVQVLVKMTAQNEEQLKIEDEKRRQENERLRLLKVKQEKLDNKLMDEKERIKPRINILIANQNFLLFWTHCYIHILNTGGDIKNVKGEILVYKSHTQILDRIPININGFLRRDEEEIIDIGNIKSLKVYNMMEFSISARDIQERKYTGKGRVNFIPNNQWCEVSMQEIKG